jgi:hypothetical protein
MGKWKWVNINDATQKTNLPIPGLLIGKEWYSKRINRKSFAVELGYQYGTKDYEIYTPIAHAPENRTVNFTEFPLILNLRYSFYKLK